MRQYCMRGIPSRQPRARTVIAVPDLARSDESRRATHGLGLERGDGLELSLDVVVDSLEAHEELLALGDNVLVLEDLAVVLEVDGRLLLLDGGVGSPGSGSALAESAELTERLCS